MRRLHSIGLTLLLTSLSTLTVVAQPAFDTEYRGVGPVHGEVPLLVVLLGPDDPVWHPQINIYALDDDGRVLRRTLDTLNPNSKRTSLQVEGGQFLTAAQGGGGELHAAAHAVGDWQTFRLVDPNGGSLESGDAVQLETANGHFVVAVGGGGGEVRASSTAAGPEETFIIRRVGGSGEIRHGDPVTFETYDGRFLEAAGGGGAGVTALPTAPGAASTFTMRVTRRPLRGDTLPDTQRLPGRRLSAAGTLRFKGQPTAVHSLTEDRQRVYAVDEEGFIHETSNSVFKPDDHWRRWTKVPGSLRFSSAPAVVHSPDGSRLSLFATGEDGHVYQIDRISRSRSRWTSWMSLGQGRCHSRPAVLYTPDGEYMRIFCTADDGFVYEKVRFRRGSRVGSWGPWSRIAGAPRFVSGPAVMTAPDGGSLEVFATAEDGRVYRAMRPYPARHGSGEVQSPGDLWGDWAPLPGATRFDSAPSVMNTADGTMALVFARGIDGKMYELAYVRAADPRWGAWTRLHPFENFASAPSVVHRLARKRHPDELRRMIFGSDRSVRGYFLESSYGQFTYSEAYITPWITAEDDPATTDWDESTFEFLHRSPVRKKSSWVVQQVERMTSFRFADYDTNADGRITQDELAILWIYPADGDARGRGFDPNPVPVPSLSVGVHLPLLVRGGAGMGIGTIAHELAHQTLNLGDLYPQVGPYSLMGYQGSIHHLDPWSKIKLDWLDPTPITEDGTYALPAVERQPVAYVLYEQGMGATEYFIIENRWPDGSYEQNLPDQGLAVWHIVERFGGNEGDWARKTIRLLSPVNGALRLWSRETASSAPWELNWADGTPSGIRIGDPSLAGPTMTFTVETPVDGPSQ